MYIYIYIYLCSAIAPEVDSLGGRYFSNAHVQKRLTFDVFGLTLWFLPATKVLNSDPTVAERYVARVDEVLKEFF